MQNAFRSERHQENIFGIKTKNRKTEKAKNKIENVIAEKESYISGWLVVGEFVINKKNASVILWKSKWTNWWRNGCMISWWISEWTDWRIHQWINWWVNGLMNEWIDEWMNWWMNELMNGWIDECKYSTPPFFYLMYTIQRFRLSCDDSPTVFDCCYFFLWLFDFFEYSFSFFFFFFFVILFLLCPRSKKKK